MRSLLLASTALLLAACGSPGPKAPPAPAGEMAMELPHPGPEHLRLQAAVGRWKAVTSMMGQDSPGTMVVEPGPGGFTVFTRFESGDMGGMPFLGRGVDGYDPGTGKYVSVWTDNMSPTMTVLTGTWDEATRTMTMLGEMPDMTGAMVPHTLTTKWLDDDTHVFAVLPAGASEPSMTIRYERQ